MTQDASRPVLVTGATGYLAGWIVRRLLEEGFTVHAAVRDPDNEAKTSHLKAMEADLPGALVLFKADLLEEGSYGPAMDNCHIVFHTASPFTLDVKDPQRDLVDPAVKGTNNVLQTANRTESVERVVLTSSCAAIYGDNADVAKAPGGVLTEAVWNRSSSLDHQSYSFSKVEAETAAWKIAEAQDRWRLVTINPALIVGPGTADTQTSESFNLMRQLGGGTMKAGAPGYEIGLVDVRDVAEAHLKGALLPEAEGRHIVYADHHSLLELAKMLREEFGDGWPFPTRELPKWLVWLLGPITNKAITRKMVALNMGYPWRADNSKSKEALGMKYRSIRSSVTDMFRQMIETGAVKKGD
ncbi:NAD-dependent epimerase/dehydratase family protein [Hoeflea sp. CAU 1731]